MKDNKQKFRIENHDVESFLKAKSFRLDQGRSKINRYLIDFDSHQKRQRCDKKYKRQNSDLSDLEHYSLSQYSIADKFEKLNLQKRTPPPKGPKEKQKQLKAKTKIERILDGFRKDRIAQQSLKMKAFKQDLELKNKASMFISRLQKQKQYKDGKNWLRKRRQLQKKQKQEMNIRQYIQNKKEKLKAQRVKQILDNIIYHEKNINYRFHLGLSRSRNLMIRSKTEQKIDDLSHENQEEVRLYQSRTDKNISQQNGQTQMESSTKEIKKNDANSLFSLRRRVNKLQAMIQTLKI